MGDWAIGWEFCDWELAIGLAIGDFIRCSKHSEAGTVLSDTDPMWNRDVAVKRGEEALREIATLFIALAPLDVVLGADRPHALRNSLIFVIIGVILLAVAFHLEGRRTRG